MGEHHDRVDDPLLQGIDGRSRHVRPSLSGHTAIILGEQWRDPPGTHYPTLGECERLIANEVLPFDVVRPNRRFASIALRPSVVEFFATHGHHIFNLRWARAPRQLFRARYSARPLRTAFEEVFGDRTFGQSRLRLVIPAYDLRGDKTYLFRTDHAAHLKRDWRERMVDVALATSAAPTYLPAHRLRGLRLIDGGTWANNPASVALVEAVRFLGADFSEIRMFSLGTTSDVKRRPRSLVRGGLLPWASHATDVILRGQALGASNLVKNLVGEQNWLRLDPRVPDKVLRLDGVSSTSHRKRHLAGAS